MSERDIEAALRAMLAERAERVSAGPALADRILAEASAQAGAQAGTRIGTQAGAGTGTQAATQTGFGRGAPPPNVVPLRTRRPWTTWTLPLIAAAAVAAIVGVLVVVHPGSSPQASSGHPVAASHSPQSPTPTPTTGTPSSSSATTKSQATFTGPQDLATAANSTTQAIQLENFTVKDLTFVGDQAWALGTATCITSGHGLCTAFVHSADDQHWTSIQTTPFNVPGDSTGCSTRCVENIRFATDEVGYVYGPSALLMTLDGGKTWTPESGGAVALETLDGNVIRVSASEPSGCPPGCTYTVQTAPIGSTHWTTVASPWSTTSCPSGSNCSAAITGDGIQLARGDGLSALLVTQNPAGGASAERSTLYTSTDNGANWTIRAEPCNVAGDEPGVEFDSTAMTVATDGAVVVACMDRARTSGEQPFVVVSTNGGKSFVEQSRSALRSGDAVVASVSAGSAQSICVTLDSSSADSSAGGPLYCSQDGGTTFSNAQGSAGGPGSVTFVGFENQTDARALEIGGSAADGAVSQMWTTLDGGRDWSVGTIA